MSHSPQTLLRAAFLKEFTRVLLFVTQTQRKRLFDEVFLEKMREKMMQQGLFLSQTPLMQLQQQALPLIVTQKAMQRPLQAQPQQKQTQLRTIKGDAEVKVIDIDESAQKTFAQPALPPALQPPRPPQHLPLSFLQRRPLSQRRFPRRQRPPFQQPGIAQSIKPTHPLPAIPEKLDILGLVKIDHFLRDPSIQSVECPGPDKQILVYKNGVIQTTNLFLTADEISTIMRDLSEKIKIPLIPGVFKAAYKDFIITSVISEFVGTRFMIQKKSALQQLE